MDLRNEIRKNSGLSNEAREKLIAYLDKVDALAVAYNAHCANDTAHNSADTTNDIDAADLPDIDD